MTELSMPERTVLWALRLGLTGPSRLSQIVKATETGYTSDGYKAVIERALAALIVRGLVQKLIVPGTKRHGPGYTLYSLTLHGYDFREDEEHGTA